MADKVQMKIEERLRAAFSEVMQKAGVLIDEALDEHFADMKAIFLRDRALAVSLALGVDMNEAGQIEVAITCGYVKEKVKQKTTARVTPGQTEIPVEAYRTVDPGVPSQPPRPVVDESRMLGAGSPQLEAGDPLHMGAGEGAGRTCLTCRFCDNGCNHEDASEETCSAPSYGLYEPDEGVQEQRDADRMSGRGPANVGSHNHSDSPFYCGDGMEYVDVENRLARVKEMGAEQLRKVVALPGCQKQVVKAAERRLKKLEKEQPGTARKTCLNCGNNDPAEEECSQDCNHASAWVAA
jgi:hypothetical protein